MRIKPQGARFVLIKLEEGCVDAHFANDLVWLNYREVIGAVLSQLNKQVSLN